ELLGDAVCVEDGARVRFAVADDRGAGDSEQRRAAVLVVAHALFEPLAGRADQQSAELAEKSFLDLALELAEQRRGHAFVELEADIARKSVADDDVDGPGRDVAPF